MKKFCSLLFITIITSLSTSCHAQKMMAKVNDAVKLENNKQQFIGEPLKVLLDQIGPQIKAVYGNPDNKSGNSVGGTYFRFHFVDKTTFLKKQNENRGVHPKFSHLKNG